MFFLSLSCVLCGKRLPSANQKVKSFPAESVELRMRKMLALQTKYFLYKLCLILAVTSQYSAVAFNLNQGQSYTCPDRTTLCLMEQILSRLGQVSGAMFFKTIPSFFLTPYYYHGFPIIQKRRYNIKSILTSKEYSSHYTGNRIIHDADTKILRLEKMLQLLDDFQRLFFITACFYCIRSSLL